MDCEAHSYEGCVLGEDATVEDYLVKVMGCTPLANSDAPTIKTYLVYDGLQLRLRYHYPFKATDSMYIGGLAWLHLGHPEKVELLQAGMTSEDICRYIVHRTLDFSFK